MTCQECSQFLLDYLEGNLPADQRAAFEQHLRRCPPCIVYIETYQRCVQMGKVCVKHTEATMLSDAPEGLINAILAARKQTGN